MIPTDQEIFFQEIRNLYLILAQTLYQRDSYSENLIPVRWQFLDNNIKKNYMEKSINLYKEKKIYL